MAALVAPSRLARSRLGRGLASAGYQFQRIGLAAASQAFMHLFHRALGRDSQVPPAAARTAAQRRFRDLLEQDLANARDGWYPARLLFRTGLRDYLRVLPQGVVDIPRVLRRARNDDFDDLPADATLDDYPRYYRRTFHWQTDGWLSERSARLYDPGVEMLFGGTADIMRRMIVPDLGEHLADVARPRILDVACGTGRFLAQLHELMPRAQLYGLDLSQPYLRFAHRQCAAVDDLSLVRDNAEAMPFADGSFEAVTCIFLFHELPKDARRGVMREALRVLAPGGIFAVVDSAQYGDGDEIRWFLDNFPKLYHEPYFKGYLQDPLEDVAREVGFVDVAMRPSHVSKVVVAARPGEAA